MLTPDFSLSQANELDRDFEYTKLSLEQQIQYEQRMGVSGIWTVRERIDGLWTPVKRKKNIFTNYGLTALASAIGGGYTAPVYLAISQNYTTYFASTSAGVSTVVLTGDPTLVGDTALTLSAGLATQENVTFTGKTGAGPYTFTLSAPTVNSHAATDPCSRGVLAGDTITTLATEAQYDPTYAAGQRVVRMAGYSTGVGNYTIQFYFTGIQITNIFLVTVGLVDTVTIATGNLHNAFVLGYNHNTTNDVEIDGSLTLVNN